jgi:hypothetical protein
MFIYILISIESKFIKIFLFIKKYARKKYTVLIFDLMNFSIEFLDQKFHLNKLKRYLNNMRLESIMIISYGNILMVLGLGSGIMLEVHLLIIMVTFFMLITTILFT